MVGHPQGHDRHHPYVATNQSGLTSAATSSDATTMMASVNGRVYAPISQMSPYNYSVQISQSDRGQACLATVYAMVERGTTGNNNIPINIYFNSAIGAVRPNNISLGPATRSLSSPQYGSQLILITGTAERQMEAARHITC
jgi:hypothetical protein